MTIRAFVALIPPPPQLDRLEALGLDIGCGRPVPWEDLHVTLAFLGEHDRHVLEDVAAELDRIRAAGVSIDDEENAEGMRCVAAAVLNEQGLPAAAISVSGPKARIGEEKLRAVSDAVKRIAAEITRDFGGRAG